MKLQLSPWPSVKHVGIRFTWDIVPPHVLLEEIHHLNVPILKTKDFSVSKKDKLENLEGHLIVDKMTCKYILI